MNDQGTILAVDDSRESLALLVGVLTTAGYLVRSADSGELALAAVAANPPDLILLDVRMDDMDGLEVCRRLKAREETRQIPIILISAFADVTDWVAGLQLGAADYITKPFRTEELLSRVMTHLSLRRATVSYELQAAALGRANDRLQCELLERRRTEDELHQTLERAGRSRRVTLSTLEDQARAVAALRVSEERLRVILQSTDDGMLAVETSGKTIFSNRRFAELWRIPQSVIDTADEDAMLDFVAEQLADPEGFRAEVKRLYATAESDSDDVRFRDGRCLERYSMPLMDRGSIIGRLWSFRDITARKQAEREIRDLSRFTSENPSPVLRIARDGTLLYINEAGLRLLPLWHLEVGHESPPLLREALLRSLDTGSTQVVDFEHGERAYSFVVTPIGAADYSNIYGQDITERRRAEAQFLQSQKMETVGQLAGGIAHDFNNLLTIINGTADLAAMNLREGDPLRTDFDDIRRAGDRAAALTRQLLAFSRKQVMELEAVNLSTLVVNMQAMLQRLIGEHLDLVVRPAEHLGSVLADPAQVEQVVMNLAVNARDAMPDGGTLTIETRDVALDAAFAAGHPSVQPGPHVMLAVSDTGAGMDAATQKRVFEPFFTTKERGKGTGLGLSTVYGIVKQSRGSIWVHSEPGRGTTFEVYLPRTDAVARPERAAPVVTPVHGVETILVVEDEAAVCRLAERVLRKAGYTVLTASNGPDALAVLERHDGPVGLVLTDMVMPGMSGRDLVARIAEFSPRMKVLYTSGYTDEAILYTALFDKATHFIGKPYAAADLTRKVREVLDAPDDRPTT